MQRKQSVSARIAAPVLALHNAHMLQAQAFTAPQFKAQDLHGLSPAALVEVAAQMLEHIGRQSQQIAERDRAIKFKDTKIERITFELARLKAWKFAARTEAMNAEQRQLFEETLAADEASLQAQLEALQAQATTPPAAAAEPKRQPKRQALPEHLVRVEHHHEPENTTCPTAECGQPMVRVGEDVSERLDIIPAQFFVHRHIRGKWACRCCQVLVQEPVEPQIIDSGMPAAGLVAHTLVSRFVDSPAVLPARGHQRPLERAHAKVYPGGVVGARRCCAGTAVRRAPRVRARCAGAASR